MSLYNPQAFKLSDEQVANVISASLELVADDAKPLMTACMFHLAWKYNYFPDGSRKVYAIPQESLKG